MRSKYMLLLGFLFWGGFGCSQHGGSEPAADLGFDLEGPGLDGNAAPADQAVAVADLAPQDAQMGCQLASPPSIDFGALKVGESSVHQNVRVTNCTMMDLDVIRVFIGGNDPAQFRVNNPGSFMLVPNQFRDIEVWYSPSAPGMHSMVLTITPMAFMPAKVSLTGSGT